MNKNIALPEDLYNKTAVLAAQEHVSVEEFVSALIASQITSKEIIESRGRRFDRAEFERMLGEVPDVEPEENDRL